MDAVSTSKKKHISKQKDEEEGGAKKRKAAAQTSKGVEKLKKVSTRGMAKLSSFFQKQDAKG